MKNRFLIISIIFVIIFGINVFQNNYVNQEYSDLAERPLQVYFIDVGQGDCQLIKFKDEYMLIDSGEEDQTKKVIEFLKSKEIEKLKYVVATHPHSDHIGGLESVCSDFEVENIIMPKITANTKTFEDLIKVIKKKNINVITAKKGDKFNIQECEFSILSPSLDDEYEELNNYSVVIKLVYGKASFLFTGDAEKEIEQKLINSGEDISAKVLKVGHHGSHTSSTKKFLDKVNSDIAVISVGEDNSYGHPLKSVLDRLNNMADYVLRTDKNGTISVYTDGITLDVISEK